MSRKLYRLGLGTVLGLAICTIDAPTAEAQFGFSFGSGGGKGGFSFGFGGSSRPSHSSGGGILGSLFGGSRRPSWRPTMRRPSRPQTIVIDRRPTSPPPRPRPQTKSVPKNNKPVKPPTPKRNIVSFPLAGEAMKQVDDGAEALKDSLDDALLAAVDPADRQELLEAMKKSDGGDQSALQKMAADGDIPGPLADARQASSELDQALKLDIPPKATGLWLDKIDAALGKLNPTDPATVALQQQLGAVEQSAQVAQVLEALNAGQPPGPVLVSLEGGVPGLPIYPGLDPVDDMGNWGPHPTAGAAIYNPWSNDGSVSYRLNKKWTYTLEPGKMHKLGAGSWTIDFDPGSGKKKSYTLSSGCYEFVVKSEGWGMVHRKKYEITIDNGGYAGEFAYACNGKDYLLKPGAKKTHSSKFPLQVSFDRADGGEPAHKRLVAGGYKVGIEPGEGCLELFDEGDLPAPDSTPNFFGTQDDSLLGL